MEPDRADGCDDMCGEREARTGCHGGAGEGCILEISRGVGRSGKRHRKAQSTYENANGVFMKVTKEARRVPVLETARNKPSIEE